MSTAATDENVSTPVTGDDLGEQSLPTAPDATPEHSGDDAEYSHSDGAPSEPQTPTESQPDAPDSGDSGSGQDASTAIDDEDKIRRGRGALENDVRSVTDAFVTGEITLADGEALTPHRIGKLIKDRDGLDKPPSTGAIVNIVKRWGEIGFAEVNEKPLAFLGYTQEAQVQGLSALKAAYAEAHPKPAKAKAAKPTDASAPAGATDGDGTSSPTDDGATAQAGV